MRRALVAMGLAAVVAGCTQTPQPPPAAPTASPPAPAAATPVPPAIAPVPAAVQETWELPGTLGPLTTRLELEQRFGKDNVREETFDGAEGIGTYPALVVFPDDPSRRLELVLDADDKDAPINELRVRGSNSRWHDASGLRPGMALADVVALNAAPVSFYGVAWDYGGVVQDWHGGRLANPVGAPVFRRVVLGPRSDIGEARVPEGDGTFRSDDAKWPGIGKDLVVDEIGISWPDDAED